MAVGDNLIKMLPGQIADVTPRNVTSFSAEEVIEFGRPLMRGTNPERQVKNFVANVGRTTKFLGISTRSIVQLTGNYPASTTVGVLEWGRIAVPLVTGLTVTAGDYAYLNQATNNITNAVATDQIRIGRFVTGGVSDGLTGSVRFILEVLPVFQVLI